MADIKIDNIDFSGLDLFSDSEDLLAELNDNDVNSVMGGMEVQLQAPEAQLRGQTYARTCCGVSGCCGTAR